MLNKFFSSIGHFFEWLFIYIQKLENLPNILFIIIGFVALAFWLSEQARYNKQAKESGSLK
ncbi:hypothetical protein FLAV_02129 [Flavobacteriales bacterium]|nr:hypothetical protein [Flavobacteriales bacterium]MCL4817095.1 hypothetical protein [Flavobacteriales bacterium]WKZ76040.1 MAG: hypothetical protein QY303_03915 [Vicingaceae bacterium]GIK70478.1 MAG: hypothetical protein BroJett020_17730 [Bacteroidota bacterium]CAG0987706.1 hypothetical protein FLAV_02129 [Flavobacteriales bacterium]